jgi:hypothetical protein
MDLQGHEKLGRDFVTSVGAELRDTGKNKEVEQ